MLFLVVDADARARTTWSRELVRAGVDSSSILLRDDAASASRALQVEHSLPVVAFVSASTDDPDRASLLSLLRNRAAFIVVTVSRERWLDAVELQRDGADDVLLLPCSPQSFAVRALTARESVLHQRPAPWHRPRFVLQQALAHPVGGEVIVRNGAICSKILVSQGRVAWVHDDTEQDPLVDRLRAFGVRVSHEELSHVVAECQRTGEHFADVLSRWGLAEREAVVSAVRALVDGRLKATLARRNGVALFLPSRHEERAKLGFTTEELKLDNRTMMPPPRPAIPAVSQPLLQPEAVAQCEVAARDVRVIDGCIRVAVIHESTSTVVHGDAEPLAWTLGAALDGLDDTRADVFACSAQRCHLARRLDDECFVYAAFDLQATSLALARRSFATALDRARH